MIRSPADSTHEAWYLTNNLRMIRATKRISQQTLAVKVNVSRQTISRIECSRQEPSVGLAIAIAETLDEPVEKVFAIRAFPAAPWRPDPWTESAKDKRRWRRILTPFRI
jgi:putative transcriptional regulator